MHDKAEHDMDALHARGDACNACHAIAARIQTKTLPIASTAQISFNRFVYSAKN